MPMTTQAAPLAPAGRAGGAARAGGVDGAAGPGGLRALRVAPSRGGARAELRPVGRTRRDPREGRGQLGLGAQRPGPAPLAVGDLRGDALLLAGADPDRAPP